MDAKLISYERPALKAGQPKAVKLLARSDRAFFAVQVVREGGENNLHSHAHVDGFWFVLSGRARFYTTGDELLGEFGPHQGVLVPREYPYWFESWEKKTSKSCSSRRPMSPSASRTPTGPITLRRRRG
jgi:mannose-6-phosphate isomerase-like protein (cupin superfamily)